ncbi:MAG: DUF6455 family protein [Pseudomonadota bacterium]
MGIASIIARFDRHADLFDRMLTTLGLRDRMSELKNVGPVYRRATMRCAGCSGAEKCASWLDEHEHAEEAPSYCRNLALMERLKIDIENESKPVSGQVVS